MQTAVNALALIAMIVVAGILFAGLFNMFRGGSGNTSQMLMRARVIAQFVAIVLLAIAWFAFAPGR